MEDILRAVPCMPRSAACLLGTSHGLLEDLQIASMTSQRWQPVKFVVGPRLLRWCAQKDGYVMLPSEELNEVPAAKRYIEQCPSLVSRKMDKSKYQLHAVAAPPWIVVHHIPRELLVYCERMELRDPIEQPLVSEALKKAPYIRVVDFSGANIENLSALVWADDGADMSHIGGYSEDAIVGVELRFLRSLIVSRTSLTVDGMCGIERLRFLRLFRADHTMIEDFRVLSRIPTLREVDIHNTPVNTKGIEGLEMLPYLERLDVSHTKVDSIRAFRSCLHLEVVHASSTAIGDDSVTAMGMLEALRELQLSKTQVTTVNPLGQCINLHRLFIGGTAVTSDGIRGLQTLDHLRTLSITNTQVDSLKPLCKCRALTELFASCLPVRNDGIEGIEELPLVELDLSWTGVDDVSQLTKCRTLRRLDVSSTLVKVDAVFAFRTTRKDVDVAFEQDGYLT